MGFNLLQCSINCGPAMQPGGHSSLGRCATAHYFLQPYLPLTGTSHLPWKVQPQKATCFFEWLALRTTGACSKAEKEWWCSFGMGISPQQSTRAVPMRTKPQTGMQGRCTVTTRDIGIGVYRVLGYPIAAACWTMDSPASANHVERKPKAGMSPCV